MQMLSMVDVLVDGPFVLAQKDITLRFRGSSNQRIIDVRRSLEVGTPTLWEDDPLFTTHTW
jgi:anaerobic ribonucleoside-triphosphate reductase activating protein